MCCILLGAAGWQKFLGRSGGRSVSVHLTQEEANVIREKRQQVMAGDDTDTVSSPAVLPDTNTSDGHREESAPPLPPKPKQKISMIGLPNADNFIVMDNSAMFSKQNSGSKLEGVDTSATPATTATGQPPMRAA